MPGLVVTEQELSILVSGKDRASAILKQVAAGVTEIDVAALNAAGGVEQLASQESGLVPVTSTLDSVSTSAAHSLLRLSGSGTLAGRAVLTLANSVKMAMPELLLITAAVAGITAIFRTYKAAQEELTIASGEWVQQIDDAAEAEEEAHLTLFKLEQSQRKWREEFEKAHPIQALFITDSQIVNETLEEQNRLLAQSSTTYEQYLSMAERYGILVMTNTEREEALARARAAGNVEAVRALETNKQFTESEYYINSAQFIRENTHEQRMLNLEMKATPEYVEEVRSAGEKVIATMREETDALYETRVAWSQHFRTMAESQRVYENRRASIIAEGNERANQLQENFNINWARRAEELSAHILEIQATRNERIQGAEHTHSDTLTRISQQLESRLSDISLNAQYQREDTLKRHRSRLEDIQAGSAEKIAALLAEAEGEVAGVQTNAADERAAEVAEHERILYNLGLIGDTKAIEREHGRHAEMMAMINRAAADEEAEIRAEADRKAALEQARIDERVAREKKAFDERMARIALEVKRQEAAAEKQYIRSLKREEKAHTQRMAEAKAFGDRQIASLKAAFAQQFTLGQEALERQLAQQEKAEQKRLADLETARKKQLEDQKRAEGRQLISTIDYWVESGEVTTQEATKMRDEIAEKYGLITEDGREFINDLRGRTRDWVQQQEDRARAIEDFARRGIKAVKDLRWELDMLHALPGPFSVSTGFQYGGIVPGAFGATQSVTAHGGEMVLTPQQQSQLFAMLSRPNMTMNVYTRATSETVQMGFESMKALA